MNGHTNGANGDGPKFTLYTNHACPYAHRAHIALKELGLPYEEVFIDLDKPREQWYLDINPRGLVPSIIAHDASLASPNKSVTLIESAIVAQFLADLYPSHLLPASSTPQGALRRARISFFTDTWETKVGSFMRKVMMSFTDEEKEKLCNDWVAALEKDIEPLLADAAPFFGGSDKLTMAEVITAPFVLRAYASGKHGLLPSSLVERMDALPNFSRWAHAVIQNESVLEIWHEEETMKRTKAKLEQLKDPKVRAAALARVGEK